MNLVASAAELYTDPNAIARHYTRFDVAHRLLFTGHSHQAWPDCAWEGHTRAIDAAARLVDDKWEAASACAERVRAGYARLLGDAGGGIALGANTHELLVRFLSALPLRERPRIVTTDGEFHSARRQLARLAEVGIDVDRIARDPAETLSERLAAAVDSRTACVVVSCVLYEDARIVEGLAGVLDACSREGAELLVDAYHALNVVPFDVASLGLEDAWVTGGGYKYCQLGEGNCFLRLPPHCDRRPVVTGWFAEFQRLESAADDGEVFYASGADRFAGSTYDPTSHYRAVPVFDFFAVHGLTPELLREVSLHQVSRLAERFDALDADPKLCTRDRSQPRSAYGGFLALRSLRAGELQTLLRERGVLTDHRGDCLRLGPAPYLCDGQIDAAAAALGEALAAVASSR